MAKRTKFVLFDGNHARWEKDPVAGGNVLVRYGRNTERPIIELNAQEIINLQGRIRPIIPGMTDDLVQRLGLQNLASFLEQSKEEASATGVDGATDADELPPIDETGEDDADDTHTAAHTDFAFLSELNATEAIDVFRNLSDLGQLHQAREAEARGKTRKSVLNAADAIIRALED